MANAILAFENQNFFRAKQLLDELSANGIPNPDAAAMRARLALKQGNLQYATKYLAQQIKQAGDHAGLRETYASALYLSGKWDEAERELTAASKLGAPNWRVAFGKGLVEEARGKFFEAKLQYVVALQAKPEWKQPQARLRALVVSGKVTELFESK